MHGRLSQDQVEEKLGSVQYVGAAIHHLKDRLTVGDLIDLTVAIGKFKSQQELGFALGVDQPYLSFIRHGRVKISTNMASKLSEISGIPPHIYKVVSHLHQ